MLQTTKKTTKRVSLALLAGLLAAPVLALAPTSAQAQPAYHARGEERVLTGRVGGNVNGNRFNLLRPGKRDAWVVLVGRRIPPFSRGNDVEVTGRFRDHQFFAHRLRVLAYHH